LSTRPASRCASPTAATRSRRTSSGCRRRRAPQPHDSALPAAAQRAWLAACAAVLRIALAAHWIARSDPGATPIPLAIETAAAAIIGATLQSRFGEGERATGRWLPHLRLTNALALTAVAAGMLVAAAAAAHLPGGGRDILRNLAGFVGIGLLSANALGGTLAWVGPVAYGVIAQYALTATVDHALDLARATAAQPRRNPLRETATFAAGMIAITLRGARDTARE